MRTPEGRSSCGVCALELGLLVLLDGDAAVTPSQLDATVAASVELYQQAVASADAARAREFVDVKALVDHVPRCACRSLC